MQIKEGVIHHLALVDNTLRDLHNSLYPTKAEFISCFIIHLKKKFHVAHLGNTYPH